MLFSAFLAPAFVGAASAPTGFIEVCKRTDASAVTGAFRFAVGAQSIVVPVGACSAPIQIAAGAVTVTEEAVVGVGVADIAVDPADRAVSTTVASRSALVTVVPGDVSTQTIVTFTNRSEVGLLTICKVAGSGVTAGTNFTFTAAGRAIAVPAGECARAGTFPYGSNVTLAEMRDPATQVAAIGVVPPNRMVGDPSLTDGTVTVGIGPGVTEVTFTNEAVPRGFLQICKRSDAGNLSGIFTFTVAGQTAAAAVGSCSPLLQVPAGLQTVTEVDRGDALVTGVTATPAARLVGTDLPGRSAQVRVAPGDFTQQTTLTFSNQPQTSQLKVCKVAGSGVLLGAPFDFTVGGSALSVPAGSCALAGTFPLNTPLTVSERVPSGMQVAAIRVDPAERVTGSPSLAGGTVSVVTGRGVTEVTFTNQAAPSTSTTVPASSSTTTAPVGPSTTTTRPGGGATTTLPPATSTTTTLGGLSGTTSTLPASTTTTPATTTPATTTTTISTTTTTPLPATTTTLGGGGLLGTTSTLPASATTTTLGGGGLLGTTSTLPASATTTTIAGVIGVTTTLPPSTTTSSPTTTTTSPGAPPAPAGSVPMSTTTTVPCSTTNPPASTATTTPGSGASATMPGSTATAVPTPDSSTPMDCLVTSLIPTATPATVSGRIIGQAVGPITSAGLALTGVDLSVTTALALLALLAGGVLMLVSRPRVSGDVSEEGDPHRRVQSALPESRRYPKPRAGCPPLHRAPSQAHPHADG